MDKMRESFVLEMERIKSAIACTTSGYLKRDYTKALKRMERELKEYDSFRNEVKNERIVNGRTVSGRI